MFPIIYENTIHWPESGSLMVKMPPLEAEIQVSPDSARRRANGYLARYIALAMEAGEPTLVWGKRPMWQMPIYLSLRGWGQVAKLGVIDVDALTRDVIELTHAQIIEIQDRADAIASRLTPTSN